LFNGDGADELMGGYLYFHNAPDATSFDLECRRLLTDIHSFDVLRSDRSIGGNGLAPRTPYLDIEFTKKYLSIPKEVRFVAQKRCEKYLIRRGCERHHYIPREVLWRTKEAMSDGVSSVEDSWHTILSKFAESQLPEPLESYVEVKLEHNTPTTKE
jgi:asparagine synthase (glutamine-hydrolysing)